MTNQKINVIVTSSLLARRNSDSRPQKIVESIADFARVRVQAGDADQLALALGLDSTRLVSYKHIHDHNTYHHGLTKSVPPQAGRRK